MTSTRSARLMAAILVATLAGCSASREVGLKTVYRDPHPALAGDLLADIGSPPKAASSSPRETGSRFRDVWYARHLQDETRCGQPFLIVEQPDGAAVDLYYDELCI